MKPLVESTYNSVINAPFESINLTEWLFTLKDSEYKACSKDHLAAGNSVTNDGKRMSINIEEIAGNLLIQHYIENISMRDHCRVQSISDSISPTGKTKLQIIWELQIKKKDALSCELTNHVIVNATTDFLALLDSLKVTDLKPVTDNMSQNLKNHNQEETPLFAKDIEAKALKGIWK